MASRNQTSSQSTAKEMQGLPDLGYGTVWARPFPNPESRNWMHLPVKISNGLPCVLYQKKGQLVQDYQMLNDMTVKNKYPVPLISKLVNQLCGAKYFTKLDVQWGFNNIQIQEGDEWKAAFQTNWGLIEPLVMFFGLTYSPATFQTMMNNMFTDMISEGMVVVYLNNILIFTKDLEEHRQIVFKSLVFYFRMD